MDKVSIIIPCYNKGKYILETLESVIRQTYKNIEIIIVDDCSPDKNTVDVLNSINFPNTKLILLKENVGVCEARNIGIRNSSGKYILPLDADDKISADYIAEAVSVFEKNPNVGIVSCRVELFGVMKGEMTLLEPTIENMIAQNALVVSSLFKREYFDKTEGFNSNMRGGLEDWDFWLSMMTVGAEIHRIPKIHFFYRIMRNSRNQIDLERLKLLRKQIYLNHADLYSKSFLDPTLSFEYSLIANSKEYLLGKFILKPIRLIHLFLNNKK